MYLPCIWGHASDQDIDRLLVKHNYAVKLIFCRHPRTNTQALYNEFRLLQVRELIKLDSLLLIFKIKNNLIETGIELLFNRDIHEQTPELISSIMCYRAPGVWVRRRYPTLQ